MYKSDGCTSPLKHFKTLSYYLININSFESFLDAKKKMTVLVLGPKILNRAFKHNRTGFGSSYMSFAFLHQNHPRSAWCSLNKMAPGLTLSLSRSLDLSLSTMPLFPLIILQAEHIVQN